MNTTVDHFERCPDCKKLRGGRAFWLVPATSEKPKRFVCKGCSDKAQMKRSA